MKKKQKEGEASTRAPAAKPAKVSTKPPSGLQKLLARIRPAQASGAEGQGSGVIAYGAALCGIAIIIMGLTAVAMAWLQFGQHQDRSAEQEASVYAEQLAGMINISLRNSEALADALAGSDAVAAAFGQDDLALAAEHLSRSMPNARVFLARHDDRTPLRDLSYTARDLVQRARTEERPPITLLPGPPPVVLVARRLQGDMGMLLLEQKLSALHQQLQTTNLSGGSLEITAAGIKEPIFSRQGVHTNGTLAVRSASGDAQVRFTLPPNPGDPELMTLFGTISAAAIVSLLGAILTVFRAMGAAVRKDVTILQHYAEDLTRPGATRPRGNFTYPPLAHLLVPLDKLAAALNASRMQASSNPTPPKPAVSGKIQVEDGVGADDDMPFVPDIMLPDEPAGGGQADPSLPPAEIFREYDIRGVVGDTLTEEHVEMIGKAIASDAIERGQDRIVVGRDGRESSPGLAAALIRGITATGCDVTDIGAVPTPMVYYATHNLGTQSGVCITGSHNPGNYNGLKIVIAGETLSGQRIRALRQRIADKKLASGAAGDVHEEDVSERYMTAVQDDIVLARPMKIVVDTGNGIAGLYTRSLFDRLGCTSVSLFEEVDGSFPNHHPDPGNPENLQALIAAVREKQADIGLAFDGDGDRLGVVTTSGEIIWPDRLMMLYAKDLLTRSPGADIIFDVKCSRELPRLISRMGGRPLMWRSGHSLIKSKLKETGAPLAGEMSGHLFFADRWFGFDDALYSAARLLEILSLEPGSTDETFATLRTGITTPEITLATTEAGKFSLIKKLQQRADNFGGGNVSTLDGLRVDFDDGWGLVRASNTTPMLTLRFEGQDQAALERIQTLFRKEILDIDANLKMPF